MLWNLSLKILGTNDSMAMSLIATNENLRQSVSLNDILVVFKFPFLDGKTPPMFLIFHNWSVLIVFVIKCQILMNAINSSEKSLLHKRHRYHKPFFAVTNLWYNNIEIFDHQLHPFDKLIFSIVLHFVVYVFDV